MPPLLRLAVPEDDQLIFGWRNDPWLVGFSTSLRTITWEEHAAWFPTVLDMERHLLFVICDDEVPAGTVRVDRGPNMATLSVYLLRAHTGQGLGPRAIKAAVEAAFERWPELQRVLAHIRADNIPSVKAFLRAGFVDAGRLADAPPGHVSMAAERVTRSEAPAMPAATARYPHERPLQ